MHDLLVELLSLSVHVLLVFLADMFRPRVLDILESKKVLLGPPG
jgi:hypothetical protein